MKWLRRVFSRYVLRLRQSFRQCLFDDFHIREVVAYHHGAHASWQSGGGDFRLPWRAGTLIGTPGNDVLTGTTGNDVIVGLDGNDSINGRGGNDLICGGNGDDVIKGGPGRDTIEGGPGQDRCKTGEVLVDCEL